MDQLPEDLRTAITLREIEGLSYEEIANVMNCPIGTVRSGSSGRARRSPPSFDPCSALTRTGDGDEREDFAADGWRARRRRTAIGAVRPEAA
jgi:hypothetical protein